MGEHHLDKVLAHFFVALLTIKVINGKRVQMNLKAQNIFKDPEPFVEEPRKTEMTDFSF